MAIPRPRQDVRVTEIPETGEGLLVIGGKRVFALNPVGLVTWRLLDGTRDEETLVSLLVAAAALPRARARADVRRFLGELAAAGVLAEETAGPA